MAFLLVWLTGWTIGEGVALFVLGAMVGKLAGLLPEQGPAWLANPLTSGVVVFILFFLAVWLFFWTIAGVATGTHLLRLLSGEDTIALTSSGVELVQRAGPFRRRRAFERAVIRRVRVRPHDKALMLDARSGTCMLTMWGSPAERFDTAAWLNHALSLPDDAALAASAMPPATWDMVEDGGVVRLRKGRPSVLSAWVRREWIVRREELTFRRQLAIWSTERSFRNARLAITHHTDSDNDTHYQLVVQDAGGKRTIHSQIHDAPEAVDLGHWLAARTGFPLDVGTGLR